MALQDPQPLAVIFFEVLQRAAALLQHPAHIPQGLLQGQKEQVNEFSHGALELTEFIHGPVKPLLGQAGHLGHVQQFPEVFFVEFGADLEDFLVQVLETASLSRGSLRVEAFQPLLVQIEIAAPARLGDLQDDLRRGLDPVKDGGHGLQVR